MSKIRVLELHAKVIYRIYSTITNGRGIIGFALNFLKNFSLVALWLVIFKNAGLIPNEWRPHIFVSLLPFLESLVFEGVSGFFFSMLITAAGYYITLIVRGSMPSNRVQHRSVKSLDGGRVRHFAIQLTFASVWFYLNFDHMFKDNYIKTLDIMAWVSYVLGHITVPIVVAIYLYLFCPPGICGTFGLSLGLLNLMGVFTHLIFPNAPPWYNELYGDLPGNYTMPGYAAGLTRVDIALGTHIHSDGFHKSPIVFGAIPSLHSAFVCLIFLYLSRYDNWRMNLIFGGIYVNWQWWATMYLSHHYRIDLIVGLTYALLSFFIFLPRLTQKENFFISKNNAGGIVSENHKTGGMRLFSGTRFERFFNSLSYITDRQDSAKDSRYTQVMTDDVENNIYMNTQLSSSSIQDDDDEFIINDSSNTSDDDSYNMKSFNKIDYAKPQQLSVLDPYLHTNSALNLSNNVGTSGSELDSDSEGSSDFNVLERKNY